MSSILDALRKAHPRKPDSTGVGEPGASETAGVDAVADERRELRPPETSPPPAAPNPSPDPDPAADAEAAVGASDAIATAVANEAVELPPSEPIEEPERPLRAEINLPPPLGEFPPDEAPQLLVLVEEAALRRKKLVRAGVVVSIGVALGLWAGNRFLLETAPESEDLLTAAALEAKGPTPAEPPAADVSAETAGARSAARAEKKAGKSAKVPSEAATNPAPPAVVPAAPGPVPTPPVVPASPADVVLPPPALPSAAIASPPAPPPAVPTPSVPAVAKAETPVPPVPTPPAAIKPPDAAPPVLGPLPDDAPQLALLFIQWSAEPSRRVASLRQSGGAISIVHEGDVIQGLKVGVIRPAAIEMQWRGLSYNLPASRH